MTGLPMAETFEMPRVAGKIADAAADNAAAVLHQVKCRWLWGPTCGNPVFVENALKTVLQQLPQLQRVL
jgi:hypothetical protein